MSASRAARRSPLMRVYEVAELFEVDPETVRVWVRDGKLRARKNPGGRVIVFNRVAVEALLNADAALTPEASAHNEGGPPRSLTTGTGL